MFNKGDRVQLSEEALKAFIYKKQRYGIVCSQPRKSDNVGILWDGTNTPVYYALCFIEPQTSNLTAEQLADKLAQALERKLAMLPQAERIARLEAINRDLESALALETNADNVTPAGRQTSKDPE